MATPIIHIHPENGLQGRWGYKRDRSPVFLILQFVEIHKGVYRLSQEMVRINGFRYVGVIGVIPDAEMPDDTSTMTDTHERVQVSDGDEAPARYQYLPKDHRLDVLNAFHAGTDIDISQSEIDGVLARLLLRAAPALKLTQHEANVLEIAYLRYREMQEAQEIINTLPRGVHKTPAQVREEAAARVHAHVKSVADARGDEWAANAIRFAPHDRPHILHNYHTQENLLALAGLTAAPPSPPRKTPTPESEGGENDGTS